MRLLKRNKRTIYFAGVSSVSVQYDEYGNETGAPLITYTAPVSADMVLSGVSGEEPFQPFGIGAGYSLIGVTDDMACPIDEESIVWVNVSTSTPHDYEVVGVSKTLNAVKYALKEVSVS